MSISALTSSTATSQLSFLSRLNGNSTSADAVGGSRPPPPPDGGGFASAIADALKAIGITDTTDTGSTGTSTSTGSTSSGTSTDSGTDTTGSTDSVAAALGSFLQSLMGALHAQNSDNSTPPPYSEGHHGGGGGKLGSDLQSLISELGSSSTATSSDSTSSTDGSDPLSQLESTFQNLLDKLGVSSDSSAADSTSGTSTGSDSTVGGTSSDANTKLAAFLQALSSKMEGNGTSGNLVNTTV